MGISLASSRPVLVFASILLIFTAGCSNRDKARKSDSGDANASPVHRGPIKLGPGEATTTPPPANSPDVGAVAALDVAGVKLGMTPEQVIAALKGFDSGLVQAKRYLTSTTDFYPASPTQTDECSDKQPYRMFSSIAAAKGTRLPGAGGGVGVRDVGVAAMGGQWVECGEEAQPGDEPETVLVVFSPTPGQHRVIGVSLWRSFKTAATVDAVMDSAMKKYPADLTAKTDETNRRARSWRFDELGRVMSEDTAKRQNLLRYITSGETDSGMPGTVYEGHGIGVDLAIETDYNNQQIAKEFRVSLYNEDALYKFIGEAKALYDAFHEKQLRDETEKAKKAETPVKM
jgi:hypothetical protein